MGEVGSSLWSFRFSPTGKIAVSNEGISPSIVGKHGLGILQGAFSKLFHPLLHTDKSLAGSTSAGGDTNNHLGGRPGSSDL